MRRPSPLVGACLAIFLGRLWLWHHSLELRTDFDLLYYAAQHLAHGVNPYPIAHTWFSYPLFYPLPAVLLALPFTALPIAWARPAFDVFVGWAFAVALWRYRGTYALLALVSGSYLYAMRNGQTTPLVTAASLLPLTAGLLVVKPNTGIALWLARPSREAVIGGAVILALSLAVLPHWPLDWWQALHAQTAHLLPPVLRPWGWVLLLAGLRWRTPEGRLIVALAVVPQTTLPHELVALALIPANAIEMGVYIAGTWVVLAVAAGIEDTHPSLAVVVSAVWPATLMAVYLPMLGLVLRRSLSSPRPSG